MRVTSHKFDGESQIVYVNYKRLNFKFRINLIGKIQIKNILMALIAAEKSGVKILTAIKNLSNLKPISGRLEKVGEIKNNSKVILDYAHTPDALKTVLENLKEQFPDKKISIVFGVVETEIRKRFFHGQIASSLIIFI